MISSLQQAFLNVRMLMRRPPNLPQPSFARRPPLLTLLLASSTPLHRPVRMLFVQPLEAKVLELAVEFRFDVKGIGAADIEAGCRPALKRFKNELSYDERVLLSVSHCGAIIALSR